MAAYVPKYTGGYSNLQAGRGGGGDRDDRRRRAVAVADGGAADDQRVRPAVGAPTLRARTPAAAIRGAYLSDPSSQPLAYHALSALMLTQVARAPRARRRAARSARRSRRSACWSRPTARRTISAAAQGNVWVPAVTAAAMVEGAALYPERAGRYLAVAEAALARLRALHQTPDRGLLVVPGERDGYDGIDSVRAHRRLQRAGAVGAGGRRRARRHAPDRRVAASCRRRGGWRSPTAARGWRSSAPAGAGWRCGPFAAASNHDLRSGFGLLALKVREGEGWRDLLAPRALFKGPPITPAPLLGVARSGRHAGRDLARRDRDPRDVRARRRATSASARCRTAPS